MQYILFSVVILIILSIFIIITQVYIMIIGNISETVTTFFIDIWKRIKR